MNPTLLASIHLVGIALLFVVILLRGMTLFKGVENNQPNQSSRKLFVALQHLSLTIVVFTGVALLVMKDFQVETWFYAKVVLFLVMVSSLIKAYKKDESILLVQRKAGWVIALVAFVAIYGLVLVKPVFG
ncbi:SirB2 family protein [Acinetobacter faecalis]|uniref:SirB2 family protein n=1 Tax=Acinetobacter faecalis TaxID=2665161 RepID=UPI002A90DF75|nr:SirB2 family protein [Acinetobacter faecalis]MDY6459334.1 SirB2 family protein [Acinetobacter faecalis]MDY6462413.1 SirB2 family protein [Acinetobacter faecalis]MDY6511501.1 SirB2 family protein [Acinetobacter faecalis]MDY6524338.1 SirB2 family protein [Acinetobacter faecalis]MDY6531354.1 SirB2 family protein [Acinetobacter faecalis]